MQERVRGEGQPANIHPTSLIRQPRVSRRSALQVRCLLVPHPFWSGGRRAESCFGDGYLCPMSASLSDSPPVLFPLFFFSSFRYFVLVFFFISYPRFLSLISLFFYLIPRFLSFVFFFNSYLVFFFISLFDSFLCSSLLFVFSLPFYSSPIFCSPSSLLFSLSSISPFPSHLSPFSCLFLLSFLFRSTSSDFILHAACNFTLLTSSFSYFTLPIISSLLPLLCLWFFSRSPTLRLHEGDAT